MILQANSPEVAVHVLSVNNCCDDFFAEVKTEVTVLFEKDSFVLMLILTIFSDAHFDKDRMCTWSISQCPLRMASVIIFLAESS